MWTSLSWCADLGHTNQMKHCFFKASMKCTYLLSETTFLFDLLVVSPQWIFVVDNSTYLMFFRNQLFDSVTMIYFGIAWMSFSSYSSAVYNVIQRKGAFVHMSPGWIPARFLNVVDRTSPKVKFRSGHLQHEELFLAFCIINLFCSNDYKT